MMPPSPMKRKRREDIRKQALTLAQKGLSETKLRVEEGGGFRAVNRRGGPVDKGTPDAQKRAAEKVQQAKRESRNESMKASIGRPEVNRQEGNPRFGQRYRTILRKGGETHDYGGGTRVFVRKPANTHNDPNAKILPRDPVKPESGGTGNHPPHMIVDPARPPHTHTPTHEGGTYSGPTPSGQVQPKRTTDNVLKPVEQAHKPASSTYDRMARDLAKRRATENMPNAKRRFASIARYSPDSGRAGRRRRRLVGIGVGSSGKRQYS